MMHQVHFLLLLIYAHALPHKMHFIIYIIEKRSFERLPTVGGKEGEGERQKERFKINLLKCQYAKRNGLAHLLSVVCLGHFLCHLSDLRRRRRRLRGGGFNQQAAPPGHGEVGRDRMEINTVSSRAEQRLGNYLYEEDHQCL